MCFHKIAFSQQLKAGDKTGAIVRGVNDPVVLAKQCEEKEKRIWYLQTEMEQVLQATRENEDNHDKIRNEMEKNISVLFPNKIRFPAN